jgi:hypothetical protein
MELVRSGELGKLLGVGTARVQQLTRHKDLPAPVAALMMGKVWDLAEVRAWAEGKGRTLHPLGE